MESSHSALKQKIGDIYHYNVALQYMLEESSWEYCDIEKNGDISLRNAHDEITYSVEVKYHNKPTDLKDNQSELWKTIHNFYNDEDKYTKNTQLILYTVSTISANNSLFDWYSLSEDEKISLLKSSSTNTKNKIYKTITKYYDVIFKDEKKLKKTLSKFDIHANQIYFKEHKNRILGNAYFRIFDTHTKKLQALYSLLSVILAGFEGAEKWTITKEDFNKTLKETSKIAQDLIIRVDDDVDIEINDEMYKDSNFVSKLNDIEQDELTVDFAIEDYAKTVYEINQRMSFVSEFDYNKKRLTYERNLLREYQTTKKQIKKNPSIIIEQSQAFYNQIQKLEKIPFLGKTFDDKTTFFQRGYFHILADDDEDKKKIINWHLEKQ